MDALITDLSIQPLTHFYSQHVRNPKQTLTSCISLFRATVVATSNKTMIPSQRFIHCCLRANAHTSPHPKVIPQYGQMCSLYWKSSHYKRVCWGRSVVRSVGCRFISHWPTQPDRAEIKDLSGDLPLQRRLYIFSCKSCLWPTRFPPLKDLKLRQS